MGGLSLGRSGVGAGVYSTSLAGDRVFFFSVNTWPLCSTVGTTIDRRTTGMLNVNANERSGGWN